MKVHKIVLMVVDSDELGADGVKTVLEEQRYPNHCIMPRVVHSESREVNWSDDHPLNQTNTMIAAFRRLFGVGALP